jgi:3-deoxy-D-manno-octulosonate 8-phosphate phosphatase (KDO 8-P phosphatase)
LKVDYLFQGISNKLKTAIELIEKSGIKLQEVAYIGDDINDIELLKAAGVSACPNSAPECVKQIAQIILKKNGGEGVFREFVEYLQELKLLTVQ